MIRPGEYGLTETGMLTCPRTARAVRSLFNSTSVNCGLSMSASAAAVRTASVIASSRSRRAAVTFGGLFGSRLNRAISSLLHRMRAEGGNDSANRAEISVNDDEYLALDNPDRFASCFQVPLSAGVKRDASRIQKHSGRVIERDRVFGEIALRLTIVPVERAAVVHGTLYGNPAWKSTEIPHEHFPEMPPPRADARFICPDAY